MGVGGLLDVVNNPMYATGVGLVLYGKRYASEARYPWAKSGASGPGWWSA
jgi:cell division ATPase FtsA